MTLEPRHTRQMTISITLLVSFIVMIKTAWIADDAEITLRCVMNFLHGYGPIYNIDERVQAFTHPLWFLLLSAFSSILGNVYVSTFVLCMGLSLFAMWLMMRRIAQNTGAGLLGAGILILSKAYTDYSASGLENPLSHVLVGLGVYWSIKFFENNNNRYARLSLYTFGISYLSRPDLVVTVAPLSLYLLYIMKSGYRATIATLLTAALPLILWSIFSLIYYGFLFPNTAYAKLYVDIPSDEKALQGFYYLLDSIGRDPLTIVSIVFGVWYGLRGGALSRALAVGIILHLIYIVSIGGDFMSGRFLTVPLYTSVLILSRAPFSILELKVLGAVVLLLGITHINSTLGSLQNLKRPKIPRHGIVDERKWHYEENGLLTGSIERLRQPQWEFGPRKVYIFCGGLGMWGMINPPNVHIIDSCGLSDPLVARLPFMVNKVDPEWRPGHFNRNIPRGYRESIEADANMIEDPKIRSFYDSIRLITRGPLLSRERLHAILQVNFGSYRAPATKWAQCDPHRDPKKTRQEIASRVRQLIDNDVATLKDRVNDVAIEYCVKHNSAVDFYTEEEADIEEEKTKEPTGYRW